MPEQPTTIETDRILVILAELDRGALDNDVITSAARDILTHTMRNQVVGKRFKTPTLAEYEIVDVYANHATILGEAHRVNEPERLDVEPRIKDVIEAMTRPYGAGVPETITGTLLQYGFVMNDFSVISHEAARDLANQAEGKLVQMHGQDRKSVV